MSLLLLAALSPTALASDDLVVRMSCFEEAPSLDFARRPSKGRAPVPASPPSVVFGGASREMAAEEASGMAERKRVAPSDLSMPFPEPEPAPVPDLDDVRDDWVAGPRPAEPSFDWGGSTWLSNDDSMSLASAQRVLWAVENGRPIPPREIRPHELLNYFTFDTVEPEGASTFEVTASGEVHDGTLSVALAVQGARPTRQPLDLTLVVDRSGSMRADGRMAYVKRGLTTMAEQLDEGDRLDLVLFDDSVCTPLENYVVGRDDPAILAEVVRRMTPRGGTDLDQGLKEGYAVTDRKASTRRRNRRVMVLTDAMLNTGDVNPHTVSEIGKRFEADGVRLTGVGVGRDFNDDVLDRLTEKGKGAYVYLGSEAVVDRVFGSGFDSLVQTIAHDVRFQLHLPDSLALERFYGEEASTVKEDIQPIHYASGTSQVFLQDLKIRGGAVPRRDRLQLEVSWRDAATGEPEARRFTVSLGDILDADPHNVRKARALMGFSDLLLADSQGDCRSAWAPLATRLEGLSDDAEIAYVEKLARRVCPTGRSWEPEPESAGRVGLKVKLDSDITVSALDASCASSPVRLTAGSSVARFEARPGRCELTLQGVVPMRTEVEVGPVDTEVRCLVRGGRISCE